MEYNIFIMQKMYLIIYLSSGYSFKSTGLLHDLGNNKEKRDATFLGVEQDTRQDKMHKGGRWASRLYPWVATSPLNIIKHHFQKHEMAYSPVSNISVHVWTEFFCLLTLRFFTSWFSCLKTALCFPLQRSRNERKWWSIITKQYHSQWN